MPPAFHPTATAYDADNALYLAAASELAYSMPNLTANVSTILGFEPKNTVPIVLGAVAGFVAADDSKIVVAFRGSEAPKTPDGIHDWLRDFEALPVPLSTFINLGPTLLGARIHQGFGAGAHAVLAHVVQSIMVLDAGRNLPLWITGHSLGGALAVATTIFLRFDTVLQRRVQGLYTYGQPRVANPILAKALDADFAAQAATGSHYIRLVNSLDIVARVPARLAPPIYADAGQFNWLNHTGTLNPTTGPNGKDLFAASFENLLAGFAPANHPFADIFANLNGDLVQPAVDHCLRDNPFTNKFNPGEYLAKLAALAKTDLPVAPK